MFPRALRALLEGARSPQGREEEGVVLSSYRANPPEADPQQVREWGWGQWGEMGGSGGHWGATPLGWRYGVTPKLILWGDPKDDPMG